MSERKFDRKSAAIVFLLLVVCLLAAYILIGNYQQQQEQEKQDLYLQGVSYGRLLEQRDALQSVLANGFYAITVVDENEQSQILRLVPATR